MAFTVKVRLLVLALALAAGLHSSDLGAQGAHYTEAEVRFRNGEVELAGTVIAPRGDGRRPGVVFLHGSGPVTRAGARPYAEEFARLGIASLIFDKRGAGSSGGSWVSSSLEDLSKDALAAVGFMKTLDGIDTARIGFWGVSQAGWVATLAASRSRDIAFMVIISGGGASPRESELFSYRTAMERAGLSTPDIADAEKVIGMYFDYLATGEGRSALVGELDGSREKSWRRHADLERILPSDSNRGNWSWVATWDPAPLISGITCPVLLMFGDRDTDHPTEIAVQKWREGLKQAGNAKATVVVYPGAGHGIRMRDGHTGSGRAPFADGYSELMLGWLWQHVVAASR